MVRHVAAAPRLLVVDTEPRARLFVEEHVLLLRAATERDDGIVLEEEQRVGDLFLDARGDEPLLELVDGRVRSATEPEGA